MRAQPSRTARQSRLLAPLGAALAVGASLATLLLLRPEAAPGTVRHVGPGDSIAGAVAAARPGDTVLVRGGRYGPLRIDRAFSSRVTIRGASGESVTVAGIDVRGRNVTVSDLRLSGQATVHEGRDVTFSRIDCALPAAPDGPSCFRLENRARNVLLSQVRVRGGEFGVKFGCWGNAWTRGVRIADSEITGAYRDLIQIDCARDVTIEHNYLHDPLRPPGEHNDAIQAIASERLRILRNTIASERAAGQAGPGQGVMLGHADPPDARRRVANTVVAANLIHHWAGTPVTVAGTRGTRIVNNTLYDSGEGGRGYGIWITAKGGRDGGFFENHELEIWNNVTTRMALDDGAKAPRYCDYNIVWPSSPLRCGRHTSLGDPLFVDRRVYRLRPRSPAIDSGALRRGTPRVDIEGQPTGAPDRGAWRGARTASRP